MKRSVVPEILLAGLLPPSRGLWRHRGPNSFLPADSPGLPRHRAAPLAQQNTGPLAPQRRTSRPTDSRAFRTQFFAHCCAVTVWANRAHVHMKKQFLAHGCAVKVWANRAYVHVRKLFLTHCCAVKVWANRAYVHMKKQFLCSLLRRQGLGQQSVRAHEEAVP